ncbi:MAG: histone deacetylase family protein [Pseudomonadota bacterium]
MQTLWLTHPSCIAHENEVGNPEVPARLEIIEAAATERGLLARVEQRLPAPSATREQLRRAHTSEHVEAIFAAAPADGRVHLDGDTSMMPATLDAALHAAGAAVAAVDEVLGGRAEAAFCNVRPPGHHAERAKAMGFCLFNNIAVAALHAVHAHGLNRVAVFDFDVHHGNGTEHILADCQDPQLLMCSLYQSPLYPYQVAANIPGRMVNVPLRPGAGGAALREAWDREWAPALRAHAPELLLISAGFDAHRRDPLGGLSFEESDYAWLTSALAGLSREVGARGVVSALEGGYDLQALASSACAHVAALLDA